MPGPPKLALCRMAKGEPVLKASLPALVCPSLLFLDRDWAMGPQRRGPGRGRQQKAGLFRVNWCLLWHGALRNWKGEQYAQGGNQGSDPGGFWTWEPSDLSPSLFTEAHTAAKLPLGQPHADPIQASFCWIWKGSSEWKGLGGQAGRPPGPAYPLAGKSF